MGTLVGVLLTGICGLGDASALPWMQRDMSVLVEINGGIKKAPSYGFGFVRNVSLLTPANRGIALCNGQGLHFTGHQ